MKYDVAGAHIVNKYLWNNLQATFGMNVNDYEGLIPIVPTQQIPVFNNLGANKPFIVYTYTNMGSTQDFWTHSEQMNYIVYSDNEKDLRRIGNFIIDLFRRQDITGQEINDLIDSSAPGMNQDEKNFQFHYTTVISTLGPEPAVTEGGRQGSAITIRYVYVVSEENAFDGNSRAMRKDGW